MEVRWAKMSTTLLAPRQSSQERSILYSSAQGDTGSELGRKYSFIPGLILYSLVLEAILRATHLAEGWAAVVTKAGSVSALKC